MTIQQLIIELMKCPDMKAEVRYKNMEIDDDCGIQKVIIKFNKDYLPQYRYSVLLH